MIISMSDFSDLWSKKQVFIF